MVRIEDFEVRGRQIILPDNPMYPRIIAEVVDDWDQDKYLALLSAAPALLRELKLVLSKAKSSYAATPSGENAYQMNFASALAAIQKAEPDQ